MYRKRSDPQRAVNEEIRHLRGLVLIRSLLADRGATAAELQECDVVIAGCRLKLAALALRTGAYASAA